MTTATASRNDGSRTVLFVGTPPIDPRAVFEAVSSQPVDIDVVADGRAAITRLTEGRTPTDVDGAPDLVCIQFGFESPDGTTLLRAIKSSPRLQSVPVVALTPDDRDAETVYRHGGNAHVTIPESTAAYTAAVVSISEFWVEWTQQRTECLYCDR